MEKRKQEATSKINMRLAWININVEDKKHYGEEGRCKKKKWKSKQ